MDIVSAITQLGLPTDSYVVVGSSALVLLEVLPAGANQDIDMVVTPAVYEQLAAQGWERAIGARQEPVLRSGTFDVGIKFGDWAVPELLGDARTMHGIPVIAPEKLLLWMQVTQRPKDEPRIPLLAAYIGRQ